MEQKQSSLSDEQLTKLVTSCGRMAAFGIAVVILGLLVFVVGIAFAFIGHGLGSAGRILLIVGAAAFVFGIVFSGQARKRQTKLLQDQLGSSFSAEYEKAIGPFRELKSAEEKNLVEDDIDFAQLISGWNRCETRQDLTGTCEGMEYRAANIQLRDDGSREIQDDTGKTVTKYYDEVVFSGVWISAGRTHTVPSPVFICEKKDGKILASNFTAPDTRVAKRFAIFCEDQNAASTLVNQAFCEKLLALANLAEGRLNLCFTGGELFCAIETDHVFYGVDASGTASVTSLTTLRDAFRQNLIYESNILHALLPLR